MNAGQQEHREIGATFRNFQAAKMWVLVARSIQHGKFWDWLELHTGEAGPGEDLSNIGEAGPGEAGPGEDGLPVGIMPSSSNR